MDAKKSGFSAPPPGLPPSIPRNKVIDNSANTTKAQIDNHVGILDELPDDPKEMEKKLSREKVQFFQEIEMDRILTAFKLNPYDILECPMEADEKQITKIYRKKSLLIHPDKVKDPRAEHAFSLLKQASMHLLDEKKRNSLDEVVMSARILCLRELGLPANIDSNDDRLSGLMPSFDERVRKGTKEMMIDDEVRRRRAIRIQHAAEGEEQRKREDAEKERKRKLEEKEQWENNRQDRIDNWRQFQKGGTSGKSKKKKVSSNEPPLLG